MRLRRHRSTIRLDATELRALKRICTSLGGGSAEKASGEDESSISAAFPGVVSKRALYPNLAAGFWEHDAPVQEERVTT